MGKRHLNIILMSEFNNLSVLPFYGNVNEQNAYLHIRGHNLFDLVAYIGDLLCRGTSVSFKKDVLMNGLPPQTYWQIKKVVEDIAVIV